jgi:hypothetical protein
MAGLSGNQRIIDILAAAEQLAPSAPAPAPEAPKKAGRQCAFGHEAEAGARFCPVCGLSMNAQVPTAPADPEAARPKPAAVLTPEERAEREAQHAQAMAAAAQFEHAPEQILPSKGEVITIHFIEDGLTVFGRVWYRGQELAIGPDHPRWPEAVGWITLDRAGQYNRWNRQYFDRGPWPFQRSYVDPAAHYENLRALSGDGTLAGPSEEELRRADEAEARRGRGVPAPALR